MKKSNFYKKIIVDALSALQQGQLQMTCPDGSELVFGLGKTDRTARLRVLRDDFFKKCALYADVGFGESFVDGDWDSDDVASVIGWMLDNVNDHPALATHGKKQTSFNWLGFWNVLSHQLKNNSISGSKKNIKAHYDLGNDFFKTFLDPSMTYSSAYYEKPGIDLEAAQYAKIDRLCRKLRLQASDHVLEIGCGWGGFSTHAAKHYGCRVKAITVSPAQFEYARALVKQKGLSGRVEIELTDYRHVRGLYDKIVSVEMIEAVGHRYLSQYFAVCSERLSRNGILALQMILAPNSRYDQYRKGVDWIQKHIFPGGLLPSLGAIQAAIGSAAAELDMYDYEDITPHYALTLRAWHDNFISNIAHIKKQGFDDIFIRKWVYYFEYCRAAFLSRNIYAAQAVWMRPNHRLEVKAS